MVCSHKELKKKIKIIDLLKFIYLCQEDEGYYRGRTLTKKIIKEELKKYIKYEDNSRTN